MADALGLFLPHVRWDSYGERARVGGDRGFQHSYSFTW
jgi:hypothetical protein